MKPRLASDLLLESRVSGLPVSALTDPQVAAIFHHSDLSPTTLRAVATAYRYVDFHLGLKALMPR